MFKYNGDTYADTKETIDITIMGNEYQLVVEISQDDVSIEDWLFDGEVSFEHGTKDGFDWVLAYKGGWNQYNVYYRWTPAEIRAVCGDHLSDEEIKGLFNRQIEEISGWFNDQWTMVTMSVTLLFEGDDIDVSSCGMIKSDDTDGIREWVNELANDLIDVETTRVRTCDGRQKELELNGLL